MLQNVQDVLAARLAILVENEKLEAGEANIAVRAIKVLVENSDTDELATALENAMWMDNTVRELGEPTEAEVGTMLDEQLEAKPVRRTRPVREGVDNDGLTDTEVNEAMAEQA